LARKKKVEKAVKAEFTGTTTTFTGFTGFLRPGCEKYKCLGTAPPADASVYASRHAASADLQGRIVLRIIVAGVDHDVCACLYLLGKKLKGQCIEALRRNSPQASPLTVH